MALWAVFAVTAFADLPFRNHRYDAFKVLPITQDDIVFIGNSITNMNEWWETFSSNHNIKNRGVSGAFSHEALENIEAVAVGKPKKVFFMIGTNDLGINGTRDLPGIITNTRLMIERLQKVSPSTEIYIQSILPSTYNRNLQDEIDTNEKLKALCEEKSVIYIDLWDDLYSLTQNQNHTLDGLHLKASGYQIWAKKIEQYVGSACSYPENCLSVQGTNGITNAAYGMRATVFSTLPVNEDDILIIGDEMIHGGEWHELLQSNKVKSRGTGWGYPGPGLSMTLNEIPLILNTMSGSCKPSKIFLYAGVGDVNGSTSLSTLQTTYRSIVNKIKELAPSATVYLMSLQPRSNASMNTSRIAPFNELIKAIADADDSVEYVDIYTGFISNGVANTSYFTGDYLYGMGYVKVAQKIAEAIDDESIVALTDEEAQANLDQFNMRSALGNSIVTAMKLPEGTGVGEYTTESLTELRSMIDDAYALLTDGGTEAEFEEMGEKITVAATKAIESINKPQTSTDGNEYWYKMYTPNRDSRYLTSQGAGANTIGEADNNYAKSQWKFVERTDGSLDIINRNDNSYLSPNANYNSAISTTSTAPSTGWELSYSNSAGLFIIRSGNVQLNQTQSSLGYKVYNWSTNSDGLDRNDSGCQYCIELVTEEPEVEDVVEGQINNTSEITAGWYQIKVISSTATDMTNAVSAGKNYILSASAEYRQNASNWYPLKYAALDEENPVTSYIYITPGGTNFNVKALNGHHLNDNATAARTATNAIAISGTSGNMIVAKWSAYNSGGAEQPYVGKYSNSTTTSNIFRVPTTEINKYDIYTVSINGATSGSEIGYDVQITCNNENNLSLSQVYNGGYFFFPKGTEVSASDFSAPQQGGMNAKIQVSNKTVTVSYETITGSDVKYSTEGNYTWYYIVSAASNAYCAGKAIKTNGDAALTYADVELDPTMIWCFMKDENNNVAIRNYNGKYMSKIQDKNHEAAGMVEEAHYNYTLTQWSGASQLANAYTIQSDASSSPIHAQEANVVIVTWPASDNGASLWVLQELTEEELGQEITIKSLNVQHSAMGVGIGGSDYALLRMNCVVEGLSGNKNFTAISGSVNSNAVSSVKIYSNNDMYEYYTGKEGTTLLGSATPDESGNFTITFTTPIEVKNSASSYLWLTADIKDNAEEGEIIDAEITSYTIDGNTIATKNGNPTYSATVFLSASTVEYCNTYDSRYYRIPAITTAKNGWLVAVTDKRWGSNGDLPNNIDVVARVSKDNGETWSLPVTIAGTAELGGDYGHGDPAIVTDLVTGDIFVLVCSKEGFFYGTPTNPQLIKVIASRDNGETWEAPVDITNQLYGAGCSDSERSSIHSLFPSSGSFMQTKDGTLMCVAPTRPTSSGTHSTFQARIISSSDHGATWTLSNNYAMLDADESKIVELDNGDLLVSSRHASYRYFATSNDGGASWSTRNTWSDLYEPGCNGDLIRLTSISGGSDKNRLLHSIPNASSRQNVTVFLSTDEGSSWPVKKSICEKGSAYSSLTVLPDGSIGCYYEEDALEGGYQMRYVRFSLDWLTNGADSIDAEDVKSVTSIENIEINDSSSKDNAIYDLMGRKVLTPASGIYIQNGKKIYIK